MRKVRIDGERKARRHGRVDPVRLKWYALQRAKRFAKRFGRPTNET